MFTTPKPQATKIVRAPLTIHTCASCTKNYDHEDCCTCFKPQEGFTAYVPEDVSWFSPLESWLIVYKHFSETRMIEIKGYYLSDVLQTFAKEHGVECIDLIVHQKKASV